VIDLFDHDITASKRWAMKTHEITSVKLISVVAAYLVALLPNFDWLAQFKGELCDYQIINTLFCSLLFDSPYESPMKNSHLLLLILAVLVLTGLGCGDGRPYRVPVSGTVTIDGEPLKSGFIRLHAEKDRPATGEISNGRFALTTFENNDGAVLGTHKVEVVAFETISGSQHRWLAPPKYRNPDESKLTATIDGPTDSLAIELSWDGGKPFIETVNQAGDSDPTKLE
jgi:hypothetical protein